MSSGARGGVDRKTMLRHRSAVNRGRSKALAASRQISKSERSLLQRRAEVPEEMLQRLEADKALIGMISRLLETGSVDDFNEAVDRINEVIAGWQELFAK
jgi:hypothetical protein